MLASHRRDSHRYSTLIMSATITLLSKEMSYFGLVNVDLFPPSATATATGEVDSRTNLTWTAFISSDECKYGTRGHGALADDRHVQCAAA
jgi:hypothetical protein